MTCISAECHQNSKANRSKETHLKWEKTALMSLSLCRPSNDFFNNFSAQLSSRIEVYLWLKSQKLKKQKQKKAILKEFLWELLTFQQKFTELFFCFMPHHFVFESAEEVKIISREMKSLNFNDDNDENRNNGNDEEEASFESSNNKNNKIFMNHCAK